MYPSLMPHAVCWKQDPQLIWTMAIANAITFLSYTSICVTLLYLARKTKRAIAREWVFFLVGFALFIVACGSTHLLEVVTTWWPVFWVDAWSNILTAALSGYVALQIIWRVRELGFGINDYAERLRSAETKRAQVEESLLSARKLEEWNRMSVVVTHEINNPLTAVQNMLFLIQRSEEASPELAGLAERASEEVRRIGMLTRSTLGFFRQEAGPERVNLVASADSVRCVMEPLARQKRIELEIENTGDCTVTAYAQETRQVILNLVRNACEATTRKGARVRIAMEGRAHDVRVAVEDEGVGIAPELLETLFQFGVSTKGDRGNGMGLWVVKQLVTRHGGTVKVESKPGEGSRFTVLWPREIPEEMARRLEVAELAGAQ